MVILTKASQQRQNIVEIQENWIVSSFRKKGHYKNFATLINTNYYTLK